MSHRNLTLLQRLIQETRQGPEKTNVRHQATERLRQLQERQLQLAAKESATPRQ